MALMYKTQLYMKALNSYHYFVFLFLWTKTMFIWPQVFDIYKIKDFQNWPNWKSKQLF